MWSFALRHGLLFIFPLYEPLYVFSLGGGKRPSTPLVIDFFFSKVSKGLCLILSARKLFELNLFFFFFFPEGEGVERGYPVVKVTF